MESFGRALQKMLQFLSLPKISLIDIIEICVITFAFYHIIFWVKRTRAWALFKGMSVLVVIYLAAYFFNMTVILWIFDKTIALGITALAIVFQPELRKALEELGRRNFLSSLFSLEDSRDIEQRISDRSVNEIVRASVELAKAKTGALIIMERDINLAEYERTGILIDSQISSQLLVNIFEHNTPLHDGAVIIRNDRVVAATCYLPLSDNLGLSKELGTRHRAGVGISEVSDSLTIVVSEETGKISLAVHGKLLRNVDGELLKKHLKELQGGTVGEKKSGKYLKIGKRTYLLNLKKNR